MTNVHLKSLILIYNKMYKASAGKNQVWNYGNCIFGIKYKTVIRPKCNIVVTWFHHVILFVIIKQHSTKSTSTYHLIPTDLPPYPCLLPDIPNLIFLSRNIALIRSAPARITSRFLQPSFHCNLTLSTSETIRELDYLTKPCDWGRHTK